MRSLWKSYSLFISYRRKLKINIGKTCQGLFVKIFDFLSKRGRVVTLFPFAFGLLDLRISENALQHGQYRVERCKAVLPNGQLVCYDEKIDPPLICQLQSEIGITTSIYLCFPQAQTVKGIQGYIETQQNAAWLAEYVNTYDQYDYTREREVLLGKMHLELLTQPQGLAQFHWLKIAEVIKETHHGYNLNSNFIPCCIQLKASPRLIEMVRDLLDMLKSHWLRTKDYLIKSKQVSQKNNFQTNCCQLLLTCLADHLAKISRYLACGEHHPERFYQDCLSLAYNLTSFNEVDLGEVNLAYCHDNLTTVFTEVMTMISRLLAVVIPEPAMFLVLERVEETLYQITHIPASLFTHTHFYLAVCFNTDDPNWTTEFTRQAKMGAIEQIDHIISSALPGVRLKCQTMLPSSISVKPGTEYFYIEKQGEYWDKIKLHGNMAVFLSQKFVTARVEIIILED